MRNKGSKARILIRGAAIIRTLAVRADGIPPIITVSVTLRYDRGLLSQRDGTVGSCVHFTSCGVQL